MLVLQDLLGLSQSPPRFAKATAQLGPAIVDAASRWVQIVANRQVGT